MEFPSRYLLDKESIRLNTYRLICHFYANREISRKSDPEERDDAIAIMEDRYFFREISRLLIDIAISVRVLDDQMNSLDDSSELKQEYLSAMEHVNENYNCMMFDEMGLREVCNKVIHANVVEPHIEETEDGNHEIDHHNWLGWADAMEHLDPLRVGDKPDPIKWKHLTNNIRLGGIHHRKQWWHLLIVPSFVGAIGDLYE